MVAAARVPIPGTQTAHWPQTAFARDVDPQTPVRMSIWLRADAKNEFDFRAVEALSAKPPRDRQYRERRELRNATDVGKDDVGAVRAYCNRYGIEITSVRWRSIEAHAPLGHFIEAFGADVALYVDAGNRTFRSRTGPLVVDDAVAPLIRGVFGFSQWPRTRRLGPLQRHVDPLTADAVASRYHFPNARGHGQTIGIIQMGGEIRFDDFARCMREQQIDRTLPSIVALDDPASAHRNLTSQDLESALDAQIIGALAPDAQIVIYRGPDSERAFLDALCAAIFDDEHDPSILSISYGWPEALWTPCALEIVNELIAVAALLGISVFCASGDNGAELDYDGKPHVLFPASSPFVHACGATAIGAVGGASESAWQHSGGGYSERFSAPAWQRDQRARAVPDVAAQESPGYCVYLNGVELAAGGTSAVAPAWSALTARINERLSNRCGLYAPMLYRWPAALTQIVDGDNGYFNAGPGWNACTGLGVPIGSAIESLMSS